MSTDAPIHAPKPPPGAPVRVPLPRARRLPSPSSVRLGALFAVLVLAFLGLVVRLWYLQIYLGEELLRQSLASRTHLIPTRAPRGDIVDRRGRPLAESRQSLSLEISPDFEETNPRLLERLAPLLSTTPAELRRRIEEERKKGASFSAPRIQDGLSPDLVARLEERRLSLNGVMIQPNPVRHYPMGRVAAHLLGYLGSITEEELARLRPYRYRAGDYVGKGGIERAYNHLLRGFDGGRRVEVDAEGNIRRVLSETEVRPGAVLTLSIDRRVQEAAQNALAREGKAGAAVAIDPRSGEVLALASYPTYDLNLFAFRRPAKLWNPLMADRRRPLVNRAVREQYPPASTFKPIVAAIGLDSGDIPPGFTVFCAGGTRIGRQWKGCHRRHGTIGFERSISESCDVFYYRAALRMGMEKLTRGAGRFGFGRKTGIDLAPEASGILPTPEWIAEHMNGWYPGNTANCGIGQGEVQASPIQMAAAVAAIANGGTLYRPRLLLHARDWRGKRIDATKPVSRFVGIRPDALARVRAAMRRTVVDGTGRVVRLPGIEVAAKTGTAQTRRGRANHGWFTCFAPYRRPTIAIAVLVEGGIHGSDSGGPVAKAMLEAYFGN